MLIKYFFQVGHQFQYDPKNGMVIPELKQQVFTKNEIIQILKKDKVEVNKLESVKYKSKKHDGWIEISDSEIIDFKASKEKELLLMLKISENENISHILGNNETQIELTNVVKSLQYYDQRIKELENILKTQIGFSITHPHHRSISSINNDLSELIRHQSGLSTGLNCLPGGINSTTFQTDDSSLDIAFMYSNPLVREIKNKPCPLNDPIDFESEINYLVEIFEKSEKKISARFEVANEENISRIIRKKPKILHISCHGAYEEVNGESKFYLYFEDMNGKLDKFDLERLKNVLISSEDEKPKSQIEIVFVSACHSEAIANAFKEAGVPVVICVHSATKVLDEAAQKFAKYFYSALLDGMSIQYSFDQAKKLVKTSNSSIQPCCCSHTHKSECRWYERSIRDKDEAHQFHVKQCNCRNSESHIHRRTCTWVSALRFNEPSFECDYSVGQNLLKICCCSPSYAHDESNKFLLKCENEFKNYTPFAVLPKGILELKNKNFCPNINFTVQMKSCLIGRNVELYNTISIFSNKNLNKNRLVVVCGNEGVGKNTFAKLAGKYMFERGFFQDGIIYINTRGSVVTEPWFISKLITNFEIDMPIDSIKTFCSLIRQHRILIIINSSKPNEESFRDIRKMVKTILEDTRSPKILITSPLERSMNLEIYENKINLEPLSEYYSAKLLMTLAGEHLPEKLRNDITEVAKHEIIEISKGIPSKIHQIAGLLQEHKKLQVLIDKIKLENCKQQALNYELVRILLDNLGSNNSSFIYEVLYMLSILPQGILECDVTEIYPDNYKEFLEILEYMSNNTIIVTKTIIKDVKQPQYCLTEELNLCVDSLNIEPGIKLKCYSGLVIHFSKLLRDIVSNLYVDNESATEFSAVQNQGMWLSLSKSLPCYKSQVIFQPAKRYALIETNILSLLKKENHNLEELMRSNNFQFRESIEEISICMPTILKMNKKLTDCIIQYNHYVEICDHFKLNIALGRLYLFTAHMNSYFPSPLKTNYSNRIQAIKSIHGGHLYNENIFAKVVQAIKLFNCDGDSNTCNKRFEEGEAEACFIKGVILYEMEIQKNIYNHERISREIFDEIVKELDRAIRIYRKIKNMQSLARASFTLAEYSIYNKQYEESVLERYKESYPIFEKDSKKLLQIKCLQGISKWYMGIKNYFLSKDYADQAKSLINKLSKNNNKDLMNYEIEKQINEILDQSRVQSHNVFVFIKAHQLIKKQKNSDLIFSRSKSTDQFFSSTNKDIEISIEPLINYHSKFREEIIKDFTALKKEIIVKFDYLTETNLQEALSKVGRVLHISSDDFNELGSLFLENSDGESKELIPNSIKAMISDNSCVAYDLVILAIPQSETLANIFVSAGVPHVICFKFLDAFLEQSDIIPHISLKNIIYDFSKSMLNALIHEHTVEDSYNSALTNFCSQINELKRHICEFNFKKINHLKNELDLDKSNNDYEISCNDFHIQKNCAEILLLPKHNNHKVKLYGRIQNNNEETVLFEGKILDLSKIRARMYKIKKREQALIGRKREIYKSINMIKASTYFNMYGDSGCGKTFLAKEISYYFYMRNYFLLGIFYFDINEVKNVEKIKALLHEADVFTAIEESKKGKTPSKDLLKVLVIFDNSDKIIKYNENQFFLFLNSLNKDQKIVNFVLTSSKKIERQNTEDLHHLEIPQLNLIEAANFYLHFVNRFIKKKEVDIDQFEFNDGFESLMNKINNVTELVSLSERVRACKGIPKYLKKLAELSLNKMLKQVELKELNLPKKKNIKEISIQSNAPSNSVAESLIEEINHECIDLNENKTVTMINDEIIKNINKNNFILNQKTECELKNLNNIRMEPSSLSKKKLHKKNANFDINEIRYEPSNPFKLTETISNNTSPNSSFTVEDRKSFNINNIKESINNRKIVRKSSRVEITEVEEDEGENMFSEENSISRSQSLISNILPRINTEDLNSYSDNASDEDTFIINQKADILKNPNNFVYSNNFYLSNSEYNIPSSRNSKRESLQPIIIQNFFNNTKIDDSNANAMSNSVNMSFNIKSSQIRLKEKEIKEIEERNPFNKPTCVKKLMNLNSFNKSNSNAKQFVEANSDNFDRNNFSPMNKNKKKKSKKGKTTGKMHSKFKKKKLNKFLHERKAKNKIMTSDN